MANGKLTSKKMNEFCATALVFIFLAGAFGENAKEFPRQGNEFGFAVNGDLIFRFGKGRWSKCFRDISVHEKRFSHVGIITTQSNAVFVVHASADDYTGIGHVKEVPIMEPRLIPANLTGR